MDKAFAFNSAIEQLPSYIKNILYNVPQDIKHSACEIKLRSNRQLVIKCINQIWYVSKNSIITNEITNNSFIVSHEMLNECFKALCSFSHHTYEEYIKMGFIPLNGGHRVGISGTAVCNEDAIENIKNITTLNIRIARTRKMPCDEKIKQILYEKTNGIILAGEPASGKTTVLRNIIDIYSMQNKNVCVVDERFEILPVGTSGFCEKLPVHCDVLSGYPKHIGMLHALKGLAPDVLICDEIASKQDVKAVKIVANAGVKIIVSMHGDSLKALKRRPQARKLIKTGSFDKIIFLSGKKNPGIVKEVIELADDV